MHLYVMFQKTQVTFSLVNLTRPASKTRLDQALNSEQCWIVRFALVEIEERKNQWDKEMSTHQWISLQHAQQFCGEC